MASVSGNTTGLKPSEIRALERLGRRRIPPSLIVTTELAGTMSQISREIGRQVGLLVTRSGDVEYVAVGDASRVVLPDFGRLRAATGRFRGLRLVHTHLRDEELSRDDLVDLTRLRLDLVAAIGVDSEGRARNVRYAHLLPDSAPGDLFRTEGPLPVHGLGEVNFAELVKSLEAEFARRARARSTASPEGRTILVEVSSHADAAASEEALAELTRLAETAGVEVAGTVHQVRDRPDPRYLLGRGKLEEVVLLAMQQDAELLIFGQDLRPNQARAISDLTDLRVIDRTQLILDIFAQRARSRDGKLQVELAQLRYRLPRLSQRDDGLSRLTGGIGGRGPGETKLEIGRRRARERVARLEREIELLARQRRQKRRRRERVELPVVAIVGYTNAGKSTLLNTLTHADTLVEDKLFATLDPLSRRLLLPSGREVVFTDTVGFIRNLPRDLLAAFRATLEELADASLLLHLVDISDPAHDDHIRTVENLLVDLKAHAIPRVLVLNKVDRLDRAEAQAARRRLGGVLTCANDRPSLDALVSEVDSALAGAAVTSSAPLG